MALKNPAKRAGWNLGRDFDIFKKTLREGLGLYFPAFTDEPDVKAKDEGDGKKEEDVKDGGDGEGGHGLSKKVDGEGTNIGQKNKN